MSGERTEKATPQRKKKARDNGDIVRSRELLSAAGMLAGMLALRAGASAFVDGWRGCYASTLRLATRADGFALQDVGPALGSSIVPVLLPIAGLMAAAVLAVVVAGVAQNGGWQMNASSMMPKLERLSPASHVKQLFSAKAMVRLAKSLLPAMVVAWMGSAALRRMLTSVPVLGARQLPDSFGEAFGLGLKAAWIMAIWAGVDYAMEWRAWNQRLKMSKQEMREEVKEAMGNPQVKGKIRQMQRQMARRKAKVDMRRASVVITNPTHYSVALEFSFEEMGAPTVLTKGMDMLALDIREEAKAMGIPIVENPPLARSLYRSVEAGQSIPYELYSAVAAILAFLFRERNEQAARDNERAQRLQAEHAQQKAAPAPMKFEGGM